MNNRFQNIILHIAGSLLFLSVPFINSQSFKQSEQMVFGAEVQREFLQFLLLLIFFYINYFFLIPKLVFTRKYFLYAGIAIVCMFIIAILPAELIKPEPPMDGMPAPAMEGGRYMPPPGDYPGVMPPPAKPVAMPQPSFSNTPFLYFFSRINHNVFLFLAVFSFSLLLRLRERWLQTEKEKLNAELQYLKAQINPHFLYNTLNSIYALALQKDDKTAEAVQQLSGLMRYVLTESANEFVPLEKEIIQIETYIRLQQLRFGNEIKLQYQVSGNSSGKQIAPLLLITFIENAFKYGVNAEENSEISIVIDIAEQLHMTVRNKNVSTLIPDDNNTRMGLNITKERLHLLYPSAHQLDISENDGYYTVELTIQL